MNYDNPIIPGFYPDPSICRVQNDFYLVTSSFQWFPGVPLFHSRDLINWHQLGFCLNRDAQLDLTSRKASWGIFAPTLRYYHNRFYMITTDFGGRGNILLWANQPQGPWSDPLVIPLPGIDPSLFFEGDQVLVQTTGDGQGIIQAELDLGTGYCNQPRLIWKGSGGRYPEGPHLYKIEGIYYLMLAEGGTEYGHMITIARSASPWGPFETCPHNPILTHRDKAPHPIQGTGHGDLVEDGQGHWWLVCLAFRPVHGDYHHLGRETFLAPVRWTKEDWPVVNEQRGLELTMQARGPQLSYSNNAGWYDRFNQPELDLRWQFLRNPQPGSWSLVKQPGRLQLQASSKPVVLAVRQSHFDLQVETKLNLVHAGSHGEAGLLVIMDERHQLRLAITGREGYYTCTVVIGDIIHQLGQLELEDEEATLLLRATSAHYYFYVKDSSAGCHLLGQMETKYFSSEVAGGFTGVMIGLFCHQATAWVDWFGYQPGLPA